MFQQITQFLRKWIYPRTRPAGWLRTRYTRTLEDEVARLRAQNRALVNSILGIAGIPPMRTIAATTAERLREDGSVAREVLSPMRVSGSGEATAAPLRRRSWQQIGRALELEDARAAQRERETDTETFPTPDGIVRRV